MRILGWLLYYILYGIGHITTFLMNIFFFFLVIIVNFYMWMRGIIGWPILALIVIYLALATGMVLTKLPWCDEAWQANPAFDLLDGGTMGVTCYETAGTHFPRLDEYTYWLPPGHYLSQAAWCKVFGQGLFQVRFHSVFWGLVLLLSVYFLAGRLLYNPWTALLATGLLALDFNFIFAAADNRMDMQSIALTMWGLSTYMHLRKHRLGRALLCSNILICLGGLTHPNGIIGAFALCFLVLYFDFRRLKRVHLAIIISPYVVGAALWGIYIMQDVSAFTAQFTNNLSVSQGSRLYGLVEPWQAIKDEVFFRYREGYGLTLTHRFGLIKAVILLSYIVGLFSWYRNKNAQAMWWMWFIYAAGLTFILGSKTITYLVYITPFFAILLAMFIHRSWVFFNKGIVAAWLCVILLVNVGITVRRIAGNQYNRYHLPAVAELVELTGEDTVVMGSGEWGFAIGFDNLIDDIRLGAYTDSVPDVVVICERFNMYYQDEPTLQGGRLKKLEEPALSHVLNILNTYHLKWENEYYKIYVRKW